MATHERYRQAAGPGAVCLIAQSFPRGDCNTAGATLANSFRGARAFQKKRLMPPPITVHHNKHEGSVPSTPSIDEQGVASRAARRELLIGFPAFQFCTVAFSE